MKPVPEGALDALQRLAARIVDGEAPMGVLAVGLTYDEGWVVEVTTEPDSNEDVEPNLDVENDADDWRLRFVEDDAPEVEE